MQSALVNQLINEIAKLPGLGKKTASRLAFHIIDMKKEDAENLAKSIIAVKEHIHNCEECFNITEDTLCSICSMLNRDRTTICVVEQVKDLYSIEKTGEYFGLYHVLHGAISPTGGVSPSDIKLSELIARVRNGGVKEVIVATNISIEGEATAQYIARLLADIDVTVTRIAHGLPVGSNLEYTDSVTVAKSLEARNKLK